MNGLSTTPTHRNAISNPSSIQDSPAEESGRDKKGKGKTRETKQPNIYNIYAPASWDSQIADASEDITNGDGPSIAIIPGASPNKRFIPTIPPQEYTQYEHSRFYSNGEPVQLDRDSESIPTPQPIDVYTLAEEYLNGFAGGYDAGYRLTEQGYPSAEPSQSHLRSARAPLPAPPISASPQPITYSLLTERPPLSHQQAAPLSTGPLHSVSAAPALQRVSSTAHRNGSYPLVSAPLVAQHTAPHLSTSIRPTLQRSSSTSHRSIGTYPAPPSSSVPITHAQHPSEATSSRAGRRRITQPVVGTAYAEPVALAPVLTGNARLAETLGASMTNNHRPNSRGRTTQPVVGTYAEPVALAPAFTGNARLAEALGTSMTNNHRPNSRGRTTQPIVGTAYAEPVALVPILTGTARPVEAQGASTTNHPANPRRSSALNNRAPSSQLGLDAPASNYDLNRLSINSFSSWGTVNSANPISPSRLPLTDDMLFQRAADIVSVRDLRLRSFGDPDVGGQRTSIAYSIESIVTGVEAVRLVPEESPMVRPPQDVHQDEATPRIRTTTVSAGPQSATRTQDRRYPSALSQTAPGHHPTESGTARPQTTQNSSSRAARTHRRHGSRQATLPTMAESSADENYVADSEGSMSNALGLSEMNRLPQISAPTPRVASGALLRSFSEDGRWD